MRLSSQRKAELAAMQLPSDEETRNRIRTFMLISGLSMIEFASLVEYNISQVSRFLSGDYYGETSQFRATVKEFMDLHEVASYGMRLDRRHHRTRAFEQVREASLNALRNGVAYIVDGPPGTEKTESFRRIEKEINTSGEGRCVYVYARINHRPQHFLSEICAAAGVPNRGYIDPLIRKLRFFLATGRTLLIIDEAQHLGHDGLEVLRQLLDLPPYFGVMLGGSHDLSQRLEHWTMEQWRSRVRKTIFLTGPTDQECRAILRAELGDVPDDECAAIIASCKATGERAATLGGKATRKKYTYTSARVLFGAIEHAKQTLTLTEKESAA